MPMRPVEVTLGAAGNSRWIPLNRYSSAFGVGIGVSLTSSVSLTYNVQHTFSDIYAKTDQFSGSRTTTSLSITLPNHGLSVGDWVQLSGMAPALSYNIFDAEYAVASITSANVFVVTVANTGAAAFPVGSGWLQKANVFNHASLVSKTASADGNYQFPPRACRLNVSSYSSGRATMNVISAGK